MSKQKKLTKTQFIRNLPLEMPVVDAVKKTKDAGFRDTNAKTIYQVRTVVRREQGLPRKSGRPAKGNGKRPSHVTEVNGAAAITTPTARIHLRTTTNDSRRALVQAVLELGFNGVESELNTIKNRMMKAARAYG